MRIVLVFSQEKRRFPTETGGRTLWEVHRRLFGEKKPLRSLRLVRRQPKKGRGLEIYDFKESYEWRREIDFFTDL